MNREEWYSLPEPLVARLEPARVREYALRTGWIYQPSLGQKLTAVYNRPESDLEQISIPLNPSTSQFTRCMRDGLVYMAECEKRPARDLLDELLLPAADLLRFQDAGPGAGGIDMPLSRSLAVVLGARKLLLAAACAVARPGQTFYPRTNLPEAERFLQQCRLVQTGRSGDAITLACPVDADPASEGFDPTPFARRVVEWLMHALRRLTESLETGESDHLLTSVASEPVLSANLCEALLDLAPPDHAEGLTLTVSWDRTHPSAAAESMVRLRREHFPGIERLARLLRPAPAAHLQTLLGLVETLNGRLNAAGRMEGEVWLTVLDPQGETVRVRADLKPEDYAAAAEAHLRALPVSLQGVLRRTGRTAHLADVTEFQVYPRLALHQESA